MRNLARKQKLQEQAPLPLAGHFNNFGYLRIPRGFRCYRRGLSIAVGEFGIRSLGEETQQIDNLLTKQPELVQTFGWYMRKMIADVRAKQATPVLLSLTVRNEWKDG
jgi:hypothetical protein